MWQEISARWSSSTPAVWLRRSAFELSNRLGLEHVAAHHGSLSRTLRLDAEQRLKNGDIKILDSDGLARARHRHRRHRPRLPDQHHARGRGRDAARRPCRPLARSHPQRPLLRHHARRPAGAGRAHPQDARRANWIKLQIPEAPIDVLMQQIVAACGAEPWERTRSSRSSAVPTPIATSPASTSTSCSTLLHEGIESTRGRYGAYLLRDQRAGPPASTARRPHDRHRQRRRHPRHQSLLGDIATGGRTNRHARRALRRRLLARRRRAAGQLTAGASSASSPSAACWSKTPTARRRRSRSGRAKLRSVPPCLSDGVGELREEIAARTPSCFALQTAISTASGGCRDAAFPG